MLVGLGLDLIQWSVLAAFHLVEQKDVEEGLAARVAVGVVSLFQYFAVLFVIEEVFFRMIDGHVHEADGGRGVASAALVSAVWGLWHLPITEGADWSTALVFLLVHVPFGLSLSLFWRRSGNLAVPGLSHALGDAIRNGIVFAG